MENIIQKFEEYFLTSSNGEIYKNIIYHVEKTLVEMVLERSSGNQVMAARMLGLNRNTLHAKLKKYSIDIQRFKE